ncbi:hypothetical protein WG901_20865 [Novosphingobium sp. PS1R-30]|uniref:Uncharacterized protein n=1 Tax=Novosphingobium anseongense TaxID=3133436 RepID=A0ABU8S2D4_9SPHN
MALEQQIEELRAELSVCSDDAERAQIAAELELAKAQLTAQERRA